MPRNRKQFKDQYRDRERTSDSPAPAAQGTGDGVTPLASIATQESVVDVAPQVSSESYASGLGYTFHNYDMFYPNYGKVLFYGRVVEFHPNGIRLGLTWPTNLDINSGYTRITAFWDDLYTHMIQKSVLRDGYRHLPDALTASGGHAPKILPWLWPVAVINCRTVRQILNSLSWNAATKTLYNELSGLNRRATEDWNALMTQQVPPFFRALALSHPVVSSKPNGPIIATFAQVDSTVAGYVGSEVDASHKVFPSLAGYMPTIEASGNYWREFIQLVLGYVENIVDILNWKATIAGADRVAGEENNLTWTSGLRDDLKYFTTLMQEQVYPMGLPDISKESVVVDPVMFKNILYGEAIYGYQGSTGYGYPYLENPTHNLILRRGFGPPDDKTYAGLAYPWATVHATKASGGYPLGMYAQVDDGNIQNQTFWLMYDRVNGWRDADDATNYDDGTSLRAFIRGEQPLADHQWNEMVTRVQDTSLADPAYLSPDEPGYQFFMPGHVPFEALRAMLCGAYNVPFVR